MNLNNTLKLLWSIKNRPSFSALNHKVQLFWKGWPLVVRVNKINFHNISEKLLKVAFVLMHNNHLVLSPSAPFLTIMTLFDAKNIILLLLFAYQQPSIFLHKLQDLSFLIPPMISFHSSSFLSVILCDTCNHINTLEPCSVHIEWTNDFTSNHGWIKMKATMNWQKYIKTSKETTYPSSEIKGYYKVLYSYNLLLKSTLLSSLQKK